MLMFNTSYFKKDLRRGIEIIFSDLYLELLMTPVFSLSMMEREQLHWVYSATSFLSHK